ncbi:hypothetical protein [Kitasatospora aureofaciens]|uniref:hypothetical protein n=1 Tax=Kitasatospora aureofaciens TaxID=1894 RepID=UPI0033FBE6D5
MDRADVVVVYYADLLREFREQGRQSGAEDELDELTDVEADLLTHLLYLHRSDNRRAGTTVPQGRLTAPHRRWIADLAESWACGERIVEWFVVRFVKEVAAYQATGMIRERVQDRLRTALEQHRPDVLIAHSLGSVVAYETLHLLQDDTAPIPLWVTLGSPLAIPTAVFDRLTPPPADGLGTRPAAVKRWANLADVGDLVAVPPKGISRRFHGVESDESCSIDALDFHLAGNYLKNEKLARILKTL